MGKRGIIWIVADVSNFLFDVKELIHFFEFLFWAKVLIVKKISKWRMVFEFFFEYGNFLNKWTFKALNIFSSFNRTFRLIIWLFVFFFLAELPDFFEDLFHLLKLILAVSIPVKLKSPFVKLRNLFH